MKNKIKSLKARYLVPVLGFASAAVVSAQESAPTLWETATTEVNSGKSALVTFLGVMILIPLAFFAYRLVKKAF